MTDDLAISVLFRRIEINSVSVNDTEANYIYDDPLIPVVPPSSRKTANYYPEYRQQYTHALQEADKGELVIDIPSSVVVSQGADVSEATVVTSAPGSSTTTTAPSFRQITVRVDFTLLDPKAGIYFVLPDPIVAPDRYPQVYSNNQVSSARLWIPCIDRWQEQCTWDLVFITPRTLRDALPDVFGSQGFGDEVDEETGQLEGDRDLIVACSGDLEEQIAHPTDDAKKISVYCLNSPASAASIMFAIGPYQIMPIPGWMQSSGSHHDEVVDDECEEDGEEASGFHRSEYALGEAYAFALPGRAKSTAYTVSFLAQALAFFERYLGMPFPYSSYKQVFVENTYNPIAAGATIALFSTHLLIDETIIDQTYETMTFLCRALVAQWFGHYVVQKTWADTWMIVGITNYLVSLFLKKFLGKNEYQYRLRKDMERVCELDVNQPPVYPTIVAADDPTLSEQPMMIDPLILQHFHPNDDWASVRGEFLSLKSPIILYMLDIRMGNGMLRKVISKVLLSTANGELANGLSTHQFLKIARKMTGKLELKSFADQWIYGSGCPRFTFKYNYNRKKMIVEFKFQQENTNRDIIGSTPKFTGPFTIRVHEPGGTYDTEVHIEDMEKQYDIQYHTKWKRIRRKTQAVVKATRNADESATVEEAVAEESKHDSKAEGKAEWNDDEPERLTFDWIRLDPNVEWLCVKVFEQSDFMWAAQLQKDRNINAQLEAIYALGRLPSQGTFSALYDFMHDLTSYYGLRMEAAYALARCTSNQSLDIGTADLLYAYRNKYCYDGNEEFDVVPKSNDFTALQEYFVKKSMVTAIASMREDDDLAPLSHRQMLLNLLKFNDNTGNMYADNYFVANLIVALGNCFLPNAVQIRKRLAISGAAPSHTGGDVEVFEFGSDSDDDESAAKEGKDIPYFEEALEEVQRYRMLDRLMPSYHNSVTIACLETLLKWMLANYIPVDLVLFLQHARYGNFMHIRLMSIDALIILNGLASPEIAQFLLSLLAEDPVPYVRYHVAKAFAELVNVMVAEATDVANQPVERLNRESQVAAAPANGHSHSHQEDGWVKARAHLSEREDIANRLWQLMNSAETLDHRVRLNLLRFCEYLYPPAPEESTADGAQRRLKIKMPPRKPADESASDDEDAPVQPKKLIQRAGPKVTAPRPRSDEVGISRARQPSKPPERLIAPKPEFLEIGEAVLTRLRNHPSSASFILPVDSGLKLYYEVIKRPMDLQTAGRNLRAGLYADDLVQFFMDIRLIFKNCYEFNQEDSSVYRQAQKLESFFEETVVPEALETNRKAKEDAIAQSPASPAAQVEPEPVPMPVAPGVEASSVPPTVVQAPRALPPATPKAPRSSTPLAPDQRSRSTTPIPEPPMPKYGITADDIRRCKEAWKVLQAHPISYWFHLPVDPVKLNIPTYSEVIKKPMDLSTIKKKLDRNEYHSVKAFESDVRLMFSNSLKFNPPDTQVHKDTRELLSVFEKQWNRSPHGSREATPSARGAPLQKTHSRPDDDSKLVENSGLSTVNRTRCERALAKMEAAKKSVQPFLQPVPRHLYPAYYEVIEKPMDMSTLRRKFQEGKYETARAFEDDVKLMFKNCYSFNRPGDPVYIQGKELESIFDKEWNRPKGTALSKRASTPASRSQSPQPNVKPQPSREASPLPTAIRQNEAKRPMLKSTPDGKTCARILKKLQVHVNAGPFLTPVDPVALNIPQYFDVIKRPMDLSTVEKKLQSGEYKTMEEFRDDVQLMFSNCFKFNLPGDWVYQQGKGLELDFQKEWRALSAQNGSKAAAEARAAPSSPRAVAPNGLSSSDKQKIRHILQKLRDHPEAMIFLTPVDPKILPDYYAKIKKPIDLKTMQDKLDEGKYKALRDFESDIKQMFANCYAYNQKTSYGHNCGLAVEKCFKREWKSLLENEGAKPQSADDGNKKRKRDTEDLSQKDKKHRSGLWTGERPRQAETADVASTQKRKRQAEEDTYRKKVKSDSTESSKSLTVGGASAKAKAPMKLKLKVGKK